MADAISIQELIDARTDAKTLEQAVNGDAVTTVLSRLGETYPTLANALSQIDGKLDSADAQIKQAITDLFQNGGLPATPFATKALMTASALVDGDYAMVTNDAVADNNGLYIKTAGAWVKSSYDPLTQAMSYTDAAKIFAISTAAGDATTKANTAKTEAIADAALDATTKADAAVITAGTNADTKIAEAFAKSSGTFDTLALLTASPLVDNAYALVANDADLTKNGHYKKLAGVWTKVKYDPLAEAKKYSDTKVLRIDAIGSKVQIYSDPNLRVGFIYWDPSLKTLNRVFKIASNVDTVVIPFSESAIYTNNNNIYVYSPKIGNLVNIYDKNDRQVVELKGDGKSTVEQVRLSGTSKVGEYYWYERGNFVFRIESLDPAKESIIPYDSRTIYMLKGRPYFYNGKALERVIKDTGRRRLAKPIMEDELSAYVNGLKFSNELNTHITELTKAGDKYAHTPSFCIHNDVGYSIFMVNYINDTETPPELNIRFHSFPMSDPTTVTYYTLSSIGDTILGRVVVKNFDSVLFLHGDIIHLMWIVTFEGDDFYTMLHQTFDTTNQQFGTIEKASFKVGNTTTVFDGPSINNAFITENIKIPAIDPIQIGLQPQISKRVEGGVDYYYAGIGAATPFTIVAKTKDFFTWEYVTHPPFEHYAAYEPAVFALGGHTYFYNRQRRDGSMYGFLTRFILRDGIATWEDPIYIPECQSRSEFILYQNKLYLIYAPKDRNHMAIMLIDQEFLERSRDVQVASFAPRVYAYPVSYEYNGELYMLFSDSKKKIYVSKYTIGGISDATIKGVMKNLFSL